MRYIGLDVGSSSIKGGLLDPQAGTISSVRSRPFPNPVTGLDPTFFEVDPDAIVRNVQAVITELTAECPDVAGLFFCSQMGGVILTNAANNPLTNYLSWRDQRAVQKHPSGKTYFETLLERIGSQDFSRIGRELKPGGAPSLLFWLAETQRMPTGNVQAMGIGEYVIARLCDAPPRGDRTSALGTVNLETRQWHLPLFERLGFGHLRWPELIEVTQVAGTANLNGRSVPCYPAIGDHQAALLGAELVEGELSVNVSTGSQVSLLTPQLKLGECQTRPYFGGRFLNTVTHLPAGRSLNALLDLLTELPRAEGLTVADPWGTIAKAVEQTTDTDLECRLTFFAGSLGDHGHLENVKLENLTVGHLFRAAFKNVADNSKVASQRLSASPSWKRIVLSGGLPQRLAPLREEIIARFGCPHRSVNVAEETLQGLLMLAKSGEPAA